MSEAPDYLKDADTLLTTAGFKAGDIWYHGTSSALLPAIEADGLKRSGDKASRQSEKKTMATIGNAYSERTDPVFLTQSKELAWYWASQTVRNRSMRFEGEEAPMVLAIALPEELHQQVKPDTGAAALLMVGQDKYLEFIGKLYEQNGLDAPKIDPVRADRMDYLNKLGMAYLDRDIDAQYVEVVTE